jgi:biopolymer transport protein ExbD
VKENADYHQHFEIISVNFLDEKSLYINSEPIAIDEMNTYILDYLSFQNNTNKALIYLNFEQNCSFGFYIAQVMKLQEIANEKVLIAPVQFIYDENLLTSCDCK